MPALMYGRFPLNCAHGEVDLDTATVKALLTDTYSFSHAHDRLTDIGSGQASGTGYTQDGMVVPGFTVSYDSATGRTQMLGEDLNYPTANLAVVNGVVFYVDAGIKPLIAFHFFIPRSLNNAPFTYYLAGGVIAEFEV